MKTNSFVNHKMTQIENLEILFSIDTHGLSVSSSWLTSQLYHEKIKLSCQSTGREFGRSKGLRQNLAKLFGLLAQRGFSRPNQLKVAEAKFLVKNRMSIWSTDIVLNELLKIYISYLVPYKLYIYIYILSLATRILHFDILEFKKSLEKFAYHIQSLLKSS